MKNITFFLFFCLLTLSISCKKDDNTTTTPKETIITITNAESSQKTWYWIPKSNMFARDGSTTGYVANLNESSSKLIIYLQGGGACFNQTTCEFNPSKFGKTEFEKTLNGPDNVNPGILSRSNADNPFKDFNYVLVPYSTGDVHSGANNDGDVIDGPQNQKMNGYGNFSIIINEIAPYFIGKGIDEIIFTGSSAGGFGTYINYSQVADAFPNIKTTMIVDAAPIFISQNIFPNCLAEQWLDLFKFPFPADYDQYVSGTYDNKIQAIYEYLSTKYPNQQFGLCSSYFDDTIRYFYGFSQNNCANGVLPIDKASFKVGLMGIKGLFDQLGNWKVYYTNGSRHTFLLQTDATQIETSGILFKDWLVQLTNNEANHIVE